MGVELSSDSMAFFLRLPEGAWDLHMRPGLERYIEGVRMSLDWKRNGIRHRWMGEFEGAHPSGPTRMDTIHGYCQESLVECQLDENGLKMELECRLMLDSPMFLWRMRVRNNSSGPVSLSEVELMRIGGASGKPVSLFGRFGSRSSKRDEKGGHLRLHHSSGALGFHTTGWQSWSFCGSLGEDDRQPRTRLGPIRTPLIYAPGMAPPKGKGRFMSDMYAVIGDRQARSGLLVGFLSSVQAFGGVDARLDRSQPYLRLWADLDAVRLDPGDSFETDWCCLQFISLDDPDPLKIYVEAAARENDARALGPVPVGWCSWYQFYENIRPEIILDNLSWVNDHRDDVPLDIIQIDDGYQRLVGDWQVFKPAFSRGMAPISNEIRDSGRTAGLWLAPFLVHPGAHILRDHPDWFLRSPNGELVNAGFNWNAFTSALDVTHPEVLEHLQEMIRVATEDWGFQYLKLDFLYAGGLKGERHDPTQTNAMALRNALAALRQAAGEEATLVGCGCPLGSGIGIFDIMRIGPDVAPRWKAAYKGIETFFSSETDLPSVQNALRSVIHRGPLHQRWWINDPDCLILRSEDSHLSQAEVETLATVVSMSAGSLMISDDLPNLGQERVAMMAKLLPPLPRPAAVLDWFDSIHPQVLWLPLEGAVGEWTMVAMINWLAKPQNLQLDLGAIGLISGSSYHSVDFWNRTYARVEGGGIEFPSVDPHGVRLVALRQVREGVPTWVGDTLHVSQGLHLNRWQAGADGVTAELEIGRRAQGHAWVSLPRPPGRILIDGKSVMPNDVSGSLVRFALAVERKASIRVLYE